MVRKLTKYQRCFTLRRIVEQAVLLTIVFFLSTMLQGQGWDWNDYVTGTIVIGRANADRSCPPIVWRVYPGTPAANAGVQPGDRLLGIDGHHGLDIVQARPLLATREPKTSTIELEGEKGSYTVNMGGSTPRN